jgi:hypothetical protein
MKYVVAFIIFAASLVVANFAAKILDSGTSIFLFIIAVVMAFFAIVMVFERRP